MFDEGSHSATILVVDDNSANRQLARAALEDEEYAVLVAENGEEALRLFESHTPDCVLLDVRTPGLDGFEVCRRLRAMPSGVDVPIVFLTAQRDVDTFDAAPQAGADDFLTKPVQPSELLVRVQSALKLRRVSAELREQYQIIKQQRDDLMRLQLQKERLSSFLVHDLKNPVNTVDLWAQQALRDPQLSERSERALHHIRDETQTLLRLILNLLDISKKDEGGVCPHYQVVDVPALIEQVRHELALKATNGGVELVPESDNLTLEADPDLLRRVLVNLTDNAIRHAPEASKVYLRAQPSGDCIRLEVSDEGSGIPLDMRERIFHPFVQLDSGPRLENRAGRGLGLAFCRVAVEAHGGQILVTDGNPGTVFVITLPRTQPPPDARSDCHGP